VLVAFCREATTSGREWRVFNSSLMFFAAVESGRQLKTAGYSRFANRTKMEESAGQRLSFVAD
jgi:hypothetical protein